MKKSFLTLLVVINCLLTIQIFGQREYTTDTLSMGPGYTNDIFYSFTDGTVKEIARNNWDIAFYTPKFSAGIMVNEGSGVTLYTYPNGDTSAWNFVDTSGMSTWEPVYNSPEVWEDGAFNRNATGHPDYGWGIYNMATHNLTGDSIYILDIPEVGLKKLWLVSKLSLSNRYTFRYADLNGGNSVYEILEIEPFENKRFAYYSLANSELIDREPESNAWDILFTKYMDLTEDNEGNWVPYLVTGATSNVDLYANEFYPVAADFENWSEIPFDSAKNVIGYDWKAFDMNTFSWQIVDSTAFFVMNYAGDVYKLTFAYWEGAATGVFALNKKQVLISDVYEVVKESNEVSTFPNPASTYVNIKTENDDSYKSLQIFDQSGRIVYQSDVSQIDLRNGLKVDLNGFAKGMYIIQLNGDNINNNQKLLVR